MKNSTILLVDIIEGFGSNGGALSSERMNNIVTPINNLIAKYMDVNLSKSIWGKDYNKHMRKRL